VSCLGEPTRCNSDIPAELLRQSLYVWEIRTPSGPVSIYDYKEWEDPDFADEKVITWSVAGRSDSFTSRMVHPVNGWVAKQTGLSVTDCRPFHHRPKASIDPTYRALIAREQLSFLQDARLHGAEISPLKFLNLEEELEAALAAEAAQGEVAF
jgi:hypothetical protein